MKGYIEYRTIRYLSVFIILAIACWDSLAAAGDDDLIIPLQINWAPATPRMDFPVRNGIPLPRGVVFNTDHLTLRDSGGRNVPVFQSSALGYWPDGSVKWALADFQACAAGTGAYQVVIDRDNKQDANNTSLHVAETDGQIDVVTGPLHFTVTKTDGGWLHELWLDRDGDGQFTHEERVVQPGSDAFIELGYRPPEDRPKTERQPAYELTEQEARVKAGMYRAIGGTDYEAKVQELGPSHVIIRCRGRHCREDGTAYATYTIWIHAFAGLPYLWVTHTFTGDADVRMNAMLDLGVSLKYDLPNVQFAFGGDRGAVEGPAGVDTTWLFYRNADPKRWPKFDQYEPAYEIRRAHTLLDKGGLPRSWVAVHDGRTGIGLIAKDMKQMYPKELMVNGQSAELVYGINSLHGDPYDWYNGVDPDEISPTGGEWDNAGTDGISRSHDFFLVFGGSSDLPRLLETLTPIVNDRPLVQYTPNWLVETQAIGPIIEPKPAEFPDAEQWRSRQAEWIYRHANDWFKWWGDVDYGGLQCYYLPEDGHWNNLIERFGWINTGYESQSAVWMTYLLSGDRQFFNMGEACSRHVADLEIDSEGAGRRMFSITFGRQGDNDHNDPGGLVWGWYMTGDYWLKEIALRSTRRCHVGKGSSSDGVRRDLCLRIRNGVRAFELTNDEQYRDNVHKNLKLLLEYQLPSGRFKEYQNSFIMPNYGAAALAEGYELTGDEKVKESLVHYACWACTGHGRDDNEWPFRSHRRLTLALNGWAYHYTQDDRFLWAIVGDLNARGYIAERLRFVPKFRNPGANIDYRFRDFNRPVCPEMFSQIYVEGKIMVRLPYALAALHQAGLTQQKYKQIIDPNPIGYAAPERGRRNVRTDLYGHVTFVNLNDVVNTNPYAKDNYHWGPVEHHFGKETIETVFGVLPFGTEIDYLGVPFRLIAPERNNSKAILVMSNREHVRINLPNTAKVLHFLGHVCGNGDTKLGQIGASYIFHYVDETTEEVSLKNCVDYEDVRLWHLSRNAPLARSWWPVFDYSKIRHVNVWSKTVLKPVRYVELVDQGLGHQFTLLAISAETGDPPLCQDVVTDIPHSDLAVSEGDKAVTLATPTAGVYDLEVCLSSEWPLLMDIYVGEQRVLEHYYVGGTFYGFDNRETLRFTIRSEGDQVPVHFSCDYESIQIPDIANWQFVREVDEAVGDPPWIEQDSRRQWTLHRIRLLQKHNETGTTH